MAIDLVNEQTFPLADAAKYLPAGRHGLRPKDDEGKPIGPRRRARVNFSTLLRWITKGVTAPDGGCVRLDAVRLGNKWITSKEALQRFAEALTPAIGGAAQPTARTPARRKSAAERAGAKLERAGI
jgi:hypothetical protein